MRLEVGSAVTFSPWQTVWAARLPCGEWVSDGPGVGATVTVSPWPTWPVRNWPVTVMAAQRPLWGRAVTVIDAVTVLYQHEASSCQSAMMTVALTVGRAATGPPAAPALARSESRVWLGRSLSLSSCVIGAKSNQVITTVIGRLSPCHCSLSQLASASCMSSTVAAQWLPELPLWRSGPGSPNPGPPLGSRCRRAASAAAASDTKFRRCIPSTFQIQACQNIKLSPGVKQRLCSGSLAGCQMKYICSFS